MTTHSTLSFNNQDIPIPSHPNPTTLFHLIQCYHCYEFGHIRPHCPKQHLPSSYSRCGDTTHAHTTCTNTPTCGNCKGGHPITSRACPTYKTHHHEHLIQAFQFMLNTKIFTDALGQRQPPSTSLSPAVDTDLSTFCRTAVESAREAATAYEFTDTLFHSLKEPFDLKSNHSSQDLNSTTDSYSFDEEINSDSHPFTSTSQLTFIEQPPESDIIPPESDNKQDHPSPVDSNNSNEKPQNNDPPIEKASQNPSNPPSSPTSVPLGPLEVFTPRGFIPFVPNSPWTPVATYTDSKHTNLQIAIYLRHTTDEKFHQTTLFLAAVENVKNATFKAMAKITKNEFFKYSQTNNTITYRTPPHDLTIQFRSLRPDGRLGDPSTGAKECFILELERMFLTT